MVGGSWDVPTIIHGKVEEGTFSGDTDDDSTGAFYHKSVAVGSGVGLMTRSVRLKHGTV